MDSRKIEQFDVIVIGAGPAGSSAAMSLASHGYRVAIVDKKLFPREKLCGGLLTQRSEKTYRQIFNKPWDEIIQYRSKGLRILDGHKLLNQLDDYKTLAFTNRRDFDAFLLDQALDAGAQGFFGEGVKEIDINNTVVTVGNKMQIKASCIVGADGVNSKVAHAIFGYAFRKPQTAFGLEIEVPRKDTDIVVDRPEIAFGHINWGYAWVFPKKDSYTVGIGGLYGKNEDIKKQFVEFSNKRFEKQLDYKIKGHFIPFGEFRRYPGRHNILLCGDAAGLVEPITGEGIAFAMQSGHYAALSCIKALQEKRPDRAYTHYFSLYKKVSRDIRHANRLKSFIFRQKINRLFLALLPRHRGALKLHVDLMSDDISYPKYAARLIKKTGKALLSGAFRG